MRGRVSVIGFLVGVFCGVSYGGWEADRRLTVYPGYYDYGSLNNAWTIAVRDTMVHIVWEHRDGNDPGELYYIRSINSGSSFDPDRQLTTGSSHYPSVAVRDSIVHVVWFDLRDGNREIYYKRSVDDGMNWGPDERLTNDPGISWYPSVAVRDSIVHVVWEYQGGGNVQVCYKQSVDNGETWEADQRLTDTPSSPRYPSVAVRDSIVRVVWYDYRDGSGQVQIYYKQSVDNGETWGIDERLTNDLAHSFCPSIAVCDSVVHVVWIDRRDGNEEIYYKRSVDDGMNWGPDERLTNDRDPSWYPSIAVCDSVVHVAWSDERDGNEEIYYKRSVDNGENWGIEERLTNAVSSCNLVSVACWNCDHDYDVHVAWTDERDGNQEIYYKRHKCEPAGVEETEELKVESLELKAKNVVSGEVRFSIYLRHSSLVELKVFDVSGKLVDSRQFAFSEGNHGFSWHNTRSGLYFFRFKIDGAEISKKVVVF